MPIFPYNASYSCAMEDREQASWDFVACEGNDGWSSTHVAHPFIVTLFLLDHLLLAFVIPGLAECGETGVYLFVGNYVIFPDQWYTETIAGQLFGDWIINGTLGVVIAWLLAGVVLRAPPLLPFPKDVSDRRGWKLFRTQLAFVVGFFVIELMTSGACQLVPAACAPPLPNNGNLFVVLPLHAALLCLMYTVQKNNRRLWGSYSPWKQRRLLFLAWLVVATLHLQNSNPMIPFYFAVDGGFTQVWLISALWILSLSVYALTKRLNIFRCCFCCKALPGWH